MYTVDVVIETPRGSKCKYKFDPEENRFRVKKMLLTAPISKDDLMEGVRLEINTDELDEVKEVYIEKNGQVSVVKK